MGQQAGQGGQPVGQRQARENRPGLAAGIARLGLGDAVKAQGRIAEAGAAGGQKQVRPAGLGDGRLQQGGEGLGLGRGEGNARHLPADARDVVRTHGYLLKKEISNSRIAALPLAVNAI